MMVSRNGSVSVDNIISDIRRGEITSVYSKLVKKLKSLENNKNDPNSIEEFLSRVFRYLCQHMAPKSDGELQKENLSCIFQCIEFCLNNIKKHYTPEEIQKIPNDQFVKTLYHTIHHFLRAKHDEYAFSLIKSFKNHAENFSKLYVDNSLFVITDSLFSITWDYLIKHEKFNAHEIFENQLVALQILSFNLKQLPRLGDFSTIALRTYCKSKDFSRHLLSCFFQNIWSYVYEYIDKCCKICVKQFIFKITCRWLTLIDEECLTMMRENLSSIFDFLLKNSSLELHQCSHSKFVVMLSEIVKFCLECTSVKEIVVVSNSWEAQLRIYKNNDENVPYISYAFNFFILFLERFRKQFVFNKTPISDLIQNNFNILSCIATLYLKCFEGNSKVSSSLLDNRSFVITTMLQIICSILQQSEDKRHLSDILNSYTEKLDILSLAEGNLNTGLESYIITLGNISQHYMQHDMYAEAVHYFEYVTNGCGVFFAKYSGNTLTIADCWKYYKLLISCYLSLKLYEDSLKSFVKGLVSKKEITISDFDLWLKIKKAASKANHIELVKKTVKDILNEIDVNISSVQEINMLEKEFLAVKKAKHYECTQEVVSIILTILKMTSAPVMKAWMLIELSQIDGVSLSIYSDIIYECKTPLLLCEQAKEILEKQTCISSKIYLSYCCFWMYLHRVNEIHRITTEEVEQEKNKSNQKTSKSSVEDENSEDDDDIKPAFCNITMNLEYKSFENLHNAVKLWKGISNDFQNSTGIIEDMQKINLFEIMITAAEIFFTSGNENESLETWSLLHKMSHLGHNQKYKFSSLCSIATISITKGYMKLAHELIKIAEEMLLIQDENISKLTELSLYCCKSLYFLYDENFSEGLKFLHLILESETLKQITKKHFIIKTEAKLILVQYMFLQKSAFSNVCPTDITGVPYDPITLTTNCFMECQQHVKRLAKEKQQNLSSIIWQQKILRLLLQSAFLAGELYLEIGSPRKARFFMEQTLFTAQSLLLTFWTSKILILWGHIDLICNEDRKCEIKLKGLEYILKEKEHVMCEVPKNKAMCVSPIENDELEDDFLKTRNDVDFKTRVRLDFLPQFEAMALSPLTHNRRKIVKSEIKKHFYCDCQHCLLCAMNCVMLEVDFLRCFYLMEKELITETTEHFLQIKHLLDQVCKNDSVLEEILWLSCYDIPSGSFKKNMAKSHTHFSVKLMVKQAICNYKDRRFDNSLTIIKEAESLLKHCVKSPIVSCPNLFALVSFHKVTLCLKFMSNQKSPIKHQKLSVEFPSTPMMSLTSNCCTPAISTKNMNRSSKLSVCNAPVKKGVLPHEVKHALKAVKSHSSSSKFPSPVLLDRSNSLIDDDAFETPMKPCIKSTPPQKTIIRTSRRLMSRQCSKSTNDEDMKNYKFFTSKSQHTPYLSAAKDIWACPPSVEAVFTFECSTPIKKATKKSKSQKTKSNAKASSVRNKKKSKEMENKSPKHSIGEPCCMENNPLKEEATSVFDISAELFVSPPLNVSIEKSRQNLKAQVKVKSIECKTLICKTPNIPVLDKPKTKVSKCVQKKKNRRSIEKPLSNSGITMTRKIKMSSKSSSTSESSLCGNTLNKPLYETSLHTGKSKKKNLVPTIVVPSIISEEVGDINDSGININELIESLKTSIMAIEHHPPYPLYAELCKTLALLMIRNCNSCNDALTIAYLLSESFAVTLKSENIICISKKINKAISAANNLSSSTSKINMPYADLLIQSISTSQDLSFSERMQNLLNHLPNKWTVVQVCIIEEPLAFETKSKQYLSVCRYRNQSVPYIKLFEFTEDCDLKFFFSKFDEIRRENTISTKTSDVKTFWKLRLKLNHRLENFVADMCSKWFGGWKGLFLGLPVHEEENDRITIETLLKSLPHKKDQEMLRVLVDSAQFLNNNEISSVICDLWNIKKGDDSYDIIFKCIRSASTKSRNVQRHPVILILDKDIQHLPWENMPIVRDDSGKYIAHPTVREPSLYFLNYQLSLYHNELNSVLAHGINSKDTFYLLNPQGDMARTQERFMDVFSKKMKWPGLIGQAPTPEEFYRALTDYNLFLYLGHGSGSIYLRNTCDMEDLPCKASAIVMGCNSGSLIKPGSQMEATGAALKYYYLGGCPSIVANLWEVTDKDIDIFTETLLETWLPNYDDKTMSKHAKLSMADAVANARNSCFLRYLNGAAPVIYGLPLFAQL